MTWGPKAFVSKAKKARTRVKVPSSVRALDKLSRKMEGPVSANMLTGIRTFKKRVTGADIKRAIDSGRTDKVMRAIPWDSLGSDLQPMVNAIAKTLEKSAKLVVMTVPAPKDKSLRLDLSNPALKAYIKNHTGALVVDITDAQRQVIKQAVKNSFAKARTPRAIARDIQDKIGLTDVQATAVDNYRQSFENAGFSDTHADKMVGDYSDRLLEQRAITIAKTETAQASGNAQLAVWHSAQDQGLLPDDVEKQWIINPGACPKICLPMDGVSVPVKSAWTISTGKKSGGTRKVMTPSQAHPACRCLSSLKFDESDTMTLDDQEGALHDDDI